MNSLRHVYFCTLAGVAEEWRGVGFPSTAIEGHEPVYIEPDMWLDVLHTVTLVDSKGSTVLYRERVGQGIIGPGTVSQNKHMAAVFTDEVKAGGVFDRDLHRIGVTVLVVSLEMKGKACEIPIKAIPQRHFAMIFVGDAQLITVNDASVSAYNIPCAE
jgi:hypothetical protein